MLLMPYIVLTAAAGLLWFVGNSQRWLGLAVAGGVLMLAVGGAVVLSDLQHKAGSEVTREYATIDNETRVTNVSERPVYETVDFVELFGGPAGHLSFGTFQMLVGGVLAVRELNDKA